MTAPFVLDVVGGCAFVVDVTGGCASVLDVVRGAGDDGDEVVGGDYYDDSGFAYMRVAKETLAMG